MIEGDGKEAVMGLAHVGLEAAQRLLADGNIGPALELVHDIGQRHAPSPTEPGEAEPINLIDPVRNRRPRGRRFDVARSGEGRDERGHGLRAELGHHLRQVRFIESEGLEIGKAPIRFTKRRITSDALRRAQIFDFSGTGVTSNDDADLNNYEIATGNLTLSNFAEGKPIMAKGFPTAFGMAPPDFTGRTVIDYTDVRSALGVGWGSAGTIAPYLSVGSDGLLLDNQNMDIDVRHYIKQGPVLIDLTALNSDTLIAPRETGRMLFYIKSRDSLRLYSDFDDFATDLSNSLDGATTARSMHARGQYDADTNVFSAYKIGVYLLEP